jgi:uncharacterized protein (TIGR03437 family)
MGVEQYDILGELYSSTGFAAADGTSFSTPLTAGSAALVLQNALKANPGLTGPDKVALVRSALINNTAQTITTDDLGQGDGVDVFEIGSGLLNAGAAVGSNITVNPATIAFNTLPSSQQFTITNNGTSSVALSIAVSPNLSWDFASSLTLTPSPTSVTLAPGASKIVTITQSGTAPTLTAGSGPGTYTGLVTIQGSGVSLVVPYAYVVGDGIDAACPTLIAFSGGFDGTVGQEIPMGGDPLFQIVDDYGVPIAGVPVTWTVSSSTTTNPTIGGGADTATNIYGLAGMGENCISCSTIAPVVLGLQPGTYSFTATTPLVSQCTNSVVTNTFSGSARVLPALRTGNPVLNAASFDTAVAAGSYIALFGTGLSDPGNIDVPNDTTRLPLAIDYVNVSFDVPSAGISVPGHLTYVSPTQVNVQVPWELQGQTSAFVKVTIDYSVGNVVTVPIQAYAPGLFEWTPGVVAALANGTNAIVNQANPATRGTVVNIYANGLGPVNNQPASGESAPASGSPACNTKSAVIVKIGNDTVTPTFAGLAPGYPALYQITLTVPTDLAVGSQPVTVTVGGVTSKASAIWLQ